MRRERTVLWVGLATAWALGGCAASNADPAGSAGDVAGATGNADAAITSGATGSGGASGGAGGADSAGSGGSAGSSGASAGVGGDAAEPSVDAATDVATTSADASVSSGKLATGPFTCTALIGLFSSGEWWDSNFYNDLGADLKPKWEGRFAHYGYTYEYAKPDSYAWSPMNVGGVNNVRLTTPCAANGSTPDRIVYQAWSWELTTEEAWVASLESALATIRSKYPSAKRIDLMTIIRCPMNQWCHPDKPPLGPNTDHDATKQDCHVPDYVDSAFAKVAQAHPDLVSVTPKFESHACAQSIDGIHLHEQNAPASADVAAYFKTMP
jgi:hypothetical protein